jgi:hypothetical protein
VLGHQAACAQPAATIAAVAGHLQHGEAAGDLAEGDDAGRKRVRQGSAIKNGVIFRGTI